MKTLIENLCGKLESWGIDPLTLLKAIGIFLIIAVLIASLFVFPKLILALLIIAACIMLIGLIYSLIE
jgi:hypothetical protein